MAKSTIVYWAPVSDFRSFMMNMTWGAPTPVLNSLPSFNKVEPSKNYRVCRGATDSFKNSFVFSIPQDIEARFYGDVTDPTVESTPSWCVPRPSSFENTYSFDLDFLWAFFSEEDVTLRLTPPYLHKTETQNYGHLVSGSFNISRWFRATNFTYNLWQNESTFKLRSGEPAAYLHFETKNGSPVKLQQFFMTQELRQVCKETVDLKLWLPFEPLNSLYKRFTQSGTREFVSKTIKSNLIG